MRRTAVGQVVELAGVPHRERVGAGPVGDALRRVVLEMEQPDVGRHSTAVIATKKAKAEKINNLQLINEDWEGLDDEKIIDLKASGIDLIICANAFHYFSDPQKAAQKFYRLLRKGGRLILLERDKSNSLLTFLWGLLHRHLVKDHVEFYTQSKLVNFFAEAGFNSVSISRCIRRSFWKGKLFTSVVILSWKK